MMKGTMTTLAFNFEEITARELKPSLLELDGISRETIEAHYKLYQGYVNKRNEILGQARRGRSRRANQVYSDLRALKVDLTFAIGGIKNHEIYFEHLGGDGGDPDGAIGDADQARLRLRRRLARRPEGDRAWRGRGWAWTAYDWDEGRLFNYIGDAQNTFPIWNATPLVALDVYEHAYFLDYQTDRASYIDAFFDNLDWGVVNGWVDGVRHPPLALTLAILIVAGYLAGSIPSATGSSARSRARTSARVGSGNIGGTNVWRVVRALVRAARRVLDMLKGFAPALVATLVDATSRACSPAARRCSATGGRCSWASRRAGRSSPRPAARSSASRRSSAGSARASGSSPSCCSATRRWRRSSPACRCRRSPRCSAIPGR